MNKELEKEMKRLGATINSWIIDRLEDNGGFQMVFLNGGDKPYQFAQGGKSELLTEAELIKKLKSIK